MFQKDLNPKRKMNSSVNKENIVTVIHDELSKTVTISLRYINDEFNINRVFNFQRKSVEDCSRVLNRMSDNITKIIIKKVKKKSTNSSKIPINLVSKEDGKLCDVNSLSCVDTFVNANNYCLRIGDITYTFDVNPPLLTSLVLPKNNIMAGFLLYPSKLEGIKCNIGDTVLKWFRTKEKFESCEKAKHNLQSLDWEEIGQGFKIVTSADDVSRLIKVTGTPCSGTRQGLDLDSISSALISPGPGPCPFEKRHKLTPKILNEDFLRIVSYNILADLYADSDHSRGILYPTCPPYALDIEYRKQLIIKEILGYNADLICLQEVDEKIFLRDLQPVFSHYGFEGIFKTKGGETVSEGLATFYCKDKLILKEECNFLLSKELEVNPLFKDLLEKVKLNPNLHETVIKRTTVLQVNIFVRKCCPFNILVVGVTHLYFRPISDHIRLLQAGICVTLLRQILHLQKAQSPNNDVSLIFCGDFNSAPENAVYRLMTSQLIDEDDADWSSKPEEELNDVSFSHDLEISSACGTPAYTNYTIGFNGCLDYIFYQSDKFSVEQVIPFPTHEEVTEHGALPSVTFPSDHIALVADLKWKK